VTSSSGTQVILTSGAEQSTTVHDEQLSMAGTLQAALECLLIFVVLC
jgi:hypothetical protein